MVGGPSNFIVNQSPNPWILGFEILDLDFGLDNIPKPRVRALKIELKKFYLVALSRKWSTGRTL